MRLIFVPLDGSPFAERALPAALDLAARHGARLELIGVHQPALPIRGGQGAVVFDQRFDADMRAGVQHYLEHALAKIRTEHPTLDAALQRLEGSPGPAIAEYARSRQADLVVLASHSRGGPARWMMGSVADSLVRSLTIPVLVVRAEDHAPTSVAASPQRVLVALDGTPESESAVATVTALLLDERATYTLLMVVPPPHPALRLLATAEELHRYMDDEQASSRDYLREASVRGAALANIQTALSADVHPAHGITQFAADNQIDLIVLSTHGRGPIGRAFLGSVADKVVRMASVPVLLCHAPRPEAASAVTQ